MLLTELLPEIIIHMSSFLSFQDILNVNKTCKRFNYIITPIIKNKLHILMDGIPEIMSSRNKTFFLDIIEPSILLQSIIVNYIPKPQPILMIERFIQLFSNHSYDKIFLFMQYFPKYLTKLTHFHFKECWPLSVYQTTYFSIFCSETYLNVFTLLLYFYNISNKLPPHSVYKVIPPSQFKFREKIIETFLKNNKNVITDDNLILAVRVGDIFSVNYLLEEGVVFDYEHLTNVCLVKSMVDTSLQSLKEKKINLKTILQEIFGEYCSIDDFYMYLLKDCKTINKSYLINVAICNDYYENICGILFYNLEYYNIPKHTYSKIYELLKEHSREYVSDSSSFFDDSESDSDDSSIDWERDYYKDYKDY